tara:strand:+ start:5574 stop:6194 length:621 start_codon:yes stop_codon:yes gene_type:complete
VAELFSDILAKGIRQGQVPARTAGAREWYRKQATLSLGKKITEDELVGNTDKGRNKTRLQGDSVYGSMYFFRYDPKHKQTLPYYDTFPCIFPINKVKGGILGLNMHYLPPKMRAQLMDALYKQISDKNYDENTTLNINYKILNSAASLKFFAPCVKMYLAKHVKSKFVRINSSEWDTALFLPVQSFQKAGQSQVWSDSRKAISSRT